ncbi:hypothetical protein L6452_33832 [Arctium lappa]|uniref:Uncharacterized protein n=1 Tax=Arctium lappa TaxID=4217 RepID=A0ACB8YH47_ARCLA|nr:hypothetical protein L6452_33832 [Arctium lappa]
MVYIIDVRSIHNPFPLFHLLLFFLQPSLHLSLSTTISLFPFFIFINFCFAQFNSWISDPIVCLIINTITFLFSSLH